MKFSEFVPLPVCHASAQQLALVSATFDQEDTPDTWTEMGELGYMVLRDEPTLKAISDQDLADACVAQVYQLMRVMGGRNAYFPTDKKLFDRYSGS